MNNKEYIELIQKFLDKSIDYYCLERGGGVEPCYHIEFSDYIWIMFYCNKVLKGKVTIKEKIYINKIQKLIYKNYNIYNTCEYGLPDVPYLLARMTKYYYKITKYIDKLLKETK